MNLDTLLLHLVESGNDYAQLRRDPASHIAKMDRERATALGRIESDHSHVDRLSESLGIPVDRFLVDSATLLGVGSALQKQLTDRLRERSENGQLGQVASHRIVDLWGKLEATRALFGSLLRLLGALDQGAIRGHSLKAQSKVLLDSLMDVIVDVGSTLGSFDSFAGVSAVIDWSLHLARDEGYSTLRDSVRQELQQISDY